MANTLNAHDLTGSDVRTDTVIADPVSASEGRTYTHEGKTGLRTHNVVMSDPNRRVAGTVEATAERSRGAGTPVPMLAVDQRDDGARDSGAVSSKWAKGTGGPSGDEAYNLTVAPTANGTQRQQVDGAMAVSAVGVPRRLMPLECERLQGWPEILELRGGSYDDIRRAVQGAYEEASPEIRQSPSLRPLWRYREADGETPPGHHEPAGSGRGTLPEVPRNGTSDEPPKAHSRSDLCRLRIYVQTQEAKSLQALLGPQLSSRDGVTFGTTKARCHATLTGWTDVPKRARKRAAGDAVMLLPPSDSKRYRAIGNGVAAPVARWVAWRIRLAAAELYLRLTRV